MDDVFKSPDMETQNSWNLPIRYQSHTCSHYHWPHECGSREKRDFYHYNCTCHLGNKRQWPSSAIEIAEFSVFSEIYHFACKLLQNLNKITYIPINLQYISVKSIYSIIYVSLLKHVHFKCKICFRENHISHYYIEYTSKQDYPFNFNQIKWAFL